VQVYVCMSVRVCVCIGEGNKTSAWRGPVSNRWHIHNRLFVVRGVLIQFWQAINNTKYCTHEGADINWAPPKILWIPCVFSLCKMARFKRAIIMPHYTCTGTSIEVSCDGSVPLCSNHGWKSNAIRCLVSALRCTICELPARFSENVCQNVWTTTQEIGCLSQRDQLHRNVVTWSTNLVSNVIQMSSSPWQPSHCDVTHSITRDSANCLWPDFL